MNGLSAAMETLGCKVNQYESSVLLHNLAKAGFEVVPFRERADVYLVHSCAVTSRAAFQTRQLLRRAHRMNPEARIVVAGCDAQLDAERLAQERLATHILGNTEKLDLLHWLEEPGSLDEPCRALSRPSLYPPLKPHSVTRMHLGRARAFLKVQDGCETFCSYCVVPYIRGRCRSLPSQDVRTMVAQFQSSGYGEVVLTGIHLGQWGKDLEPPQDLASLLSLLSKNTLHPDTRIRLSSLEPMEWTPELVDHLPSWPWICPHFHVPMQSGDEEILARMGRPYLPATYEEVVMQLHHLFPHAALGADVMVGFPGETERSFRKSYELAERLPLTYLHVFPYSPRPGTEAAQWAQRTTGSEVRRRVQALQGLSGRKRELFRERFLGQWVEVLAETQVRPGWWQGTSRNYLQVLFPASPSLAQGSLVNVRLARLTEKGLMGEPEPTPPGKGRT